LACAAVAAAGLVEGRRPAKAGGKFGFVPREF